MLIQENIYTHFLNKSQLKNFYRRAQAHTRTLGPSSGMVLGHTLATTLIFTLIFTPAPALTHTLTP